MFGNARIFSIAMLVLLCTCDASCDRHESDDTAIASPHQQTREEDGASVKGRQILEDVQSDQTDIVFYGIVVDQNKSPVEGVEILFDYRHFDEATPFGSSRITVLSGKDGRFVVKGIRGSELFLSAMSKQGYEYERFMNGITSFDYRKWKSSAFVPDEKNPVAFVLRKRNAPTLIIPGKTRMELQYDKTYLYNIRSARYWEEGKQPEGTTVLSADFRIVAKGLDEFKFGFRRVKLTFIPEKSGVIIGEKTYTAPEKGYDKESSGHISGSSGTEDRLHVFVKQEGPVYSRWDITASPDRETVRLEIESWTNPSGERNLEYDEAIHKEYLKKQEEEKHKRRNPPALVLPKRAQVFNFWYGRSYYYHIASATFWEAGKEPKDMVADIKIVAEGTKGDPQGKVVLTITALADGNALQTAKELVTAPENGYQDVAKYEISNDIAGADHKVFIYLKQKGPRYTRVELNGQFFPIKARLEILTLTNPSGDRNLEFDNDLYQQYLKQQEEQKK